MLKGNTPEIRKTINTGIYKLRGEEEGLEFESLL